MYQHLTLALARERHADLLRNAEIHRRQRAGRPNATVCAGQAFVAVRAWMARRGSAVTLCSAAALAGR